MTERSVRTLSDRNERGFAAMDDDQQREIASEGGKAAHKNGAAHELTSDEAREAGRQSHKNDDGGSRGGGSQSGGSQGGGSQGGGSTRGGTSAQHAAAGRQSYKND